MLSQEDLNRIMNNLNRDPLTGCWLWTRTTDSHGYAQIRIERRLQLVHRLMYEAFRREIPDGMCCCHRCDIPHCANPNHLFLGTNKDNTDDRDRKGRVSHGEKNGRARLTVEQVAEIRRRAASGEMLKDIAADFKIGRPAVSKIVNRKNWARAN